jgi:hypothetical protein
MLNFLSLMYKFIILWKYFEWEFIVWCIAQKQVKHCEISTSEYEDHCLVGCSATYCDGKEYATFICRTKEFLQTLIPFYQTTGTTSQNTLSSNHSFAEYKLQILAQK